jgi:cytochrome c oxidase subunit 2
MRHRKGRIAAPVLIAGITLVLAGCGTSGNNGQDSLDPNGAASSQIKDLFIPILAVAVVIGIFVLAATIYAAVRFRHREGKPDNPKQTHGNTPLEIGWTIVPALILAIIAIPTVATIWDLAETPKGPDVLKVDVTGKQWWWQFALPKQPMVPQASTPSSKKPETGPVVTSTELHIPVGTKVDLHLHSDNVIHSFWVPELAGKKDVVPGRTNRLTLEATKAGTYLGQCAEYCGLAHADMRFRVIAQPMAEWKAWLDDISGGPHGDYGTADAPTPVYTLTNKTYACTNCHVFNDAHQAPYGPNLTHLDSRTTFAGGTLSLRGAGAAQRLKSWIMNAPAHVPMASKDCRQPPTPTTICVGMPSFIHNTPKGQKTMTSADADVIVQFLLGEK